MQNVIVTGSNSGIGKETARVLAKMGASVYFGENVCSEEAITASSSLKIILEHSACTVHSSFFPSTHSSACRDEKSTNEAIEEIKQSTGNQHLHFLSLDLADLNSVRRAASEWTVTNRPLHLLINNAGVMAIPQRKLTKDGFEMQFGTNHLGHFLFTNLLLPSLADNARVINLSSAAHNMAPNGVINCKIMNVEYKEH
jgi:NAD(P)-dependent dehydrogenase (short-subunit alcohol dehydrogenase family)